MSEKGFVEKNGMPAEIMISIKKKREKKKGSYVATLYSNDICKIKGSFCGEGNTPEKAIRNLMTKKWPNHNIMKLYGDVNNMIISDFKYAEENTKSY